MENLMLSINAVMPMFLVIAAGYLARYLNILSRDDVPKFNKVAFRVFIPCLLFHNIYSSDLSQAIRPKLMVFAVLGVLFVFTCAILAVRRFEPMADRKGVVAQGIFRSNFVIMGLPIAEALVGPIKEYIALEPGARMEAAEEFCGDMARRIGALEAVLEDRD